MACGSFWARSPNYLEVNTSTQGPNLTIKRKPSIRVMSWVTFIIDWHVLMTWLNAFYACLLLNTWIWRWARQVQTKIEVCLCDLVMSTSLIFHNLDSYTYKSSYTVCIHCLHTLLHFYDCPGWLLLKRAVTYGGKDFGVASQKAVAAEGFTTW